MIELSKWKSRTLKDIFEKEADGILWQNWKLFNGTWKSILKEDWKKAGLNSYVDEQLWPLWQRITILYRICLPAKTATEIVSKQ